MTSSKYFGFGLGVVLKGKVVDGSFGLLNGDGVLAFKYPPVPASCSNLQLVPVSNDITVGWTP